MGTGDTNKMEATCFRSDIEMSYNKNKPKYHKTEGSNILKYCSKCKTWISISDFSKRKSEWDGLHYNCNTCKSNWESKYKKEYRQLNTEKVRNYQRNYRKKNPTVDKDYYLKNKKELLEKCKIYRNKNIEVKHKRDKEYYNKNRDKLIAYSTKYSRERRNKDIQYRLSGNLRHRIYMVLKGKTKKGSSVKMLGCSGNQLKKHLEMQFTEGMSWDNYGNGRGKWNIDHILPCSKFDLTKEDAQKQCFHYTNLQPLWWDDNLRKYNKAA